MKNIFKIAALVIFVFAAMGIKAQNTGVKVDQSANQSKNSVFSIKVMFNCANGKALLESELPKKRGVVSAYANLDTKIVDVTYNPNLTDAEHIKDYIHQIGYLVEGDDPNTKLEKKACSHDHQNK